MGEGIVLFVGVCFYGENVIECRKEQDIQQICHGNNDIRKQLCRFGNLGLKVHGNHGYNDDGNYENDSRSQSVGRVFLFANVCAITACIEDCAKEEYSKAYAEANCGICDGYA